MDRPNVAASPPPESPKPAPVVLPVAPSKIVVGVLTFLCCYATLVIGGIILAPLPEAKLAAISVITAIFSVLGVVIIWIISPKHTEKFPINPNHAAAALVLMASAVFLVRQFVRQTSIEDRLVLLLLVLPAIAATFLLAMLLERITAKLGETEFRHVPAFLTMALVFVAALFAVPVLFIERPWIQQLLVLANIELLIFDWFGASAALSVLTTPTTKKVPIPDGWAAAVMKNKRIDRLVINEKEVVISLKKEEVQLVDLRVRETTIRHEFESQDMAKVNTRVTCCWRVKADKNAVMKFLTLAQAPDNVFRRDFRSIVSAEVGKCDSQNLAGRQESMALSIRRKLADKAAEIGIEIMSVNVIDLHTRYPSMAQGGSATVEAMRLDQLDQSVRHSSPRTVDHVQKFWESQGPADISSAKGAK